LNVECLFDNVVALSEEVFRRDIEKVWVEKSASQMETSKNLG
jgi:hypothetical protein